MNNPIEYIPILTTCFSIYFTIEIFKHYRYRKTSYLLWWTLGVLTFGMGTLAESINVLFRWHEMNVRYWYIVGALLGGFPLAQGSVYLLLNKKFADITSVFFTLMIITGGVAVMLTPFSIPEGFNYKLTGAVFAWKWVRLFSPLINIYAFIFLVGGAIYSAYKFRKVLQRNDNAGPEKESRAITAARYKGNILIAIGGLLPGIGGTFTRMGYVNVLFITELMGL
ncbi:MAG TPA: hypothetical protein PLD36_01340, partial [Bacteroidia bacterium]|nr:hypothetical protein [Bacteroidia bacterium]